MRAVSKRFWGVSFALGASAIYGSSFWWMNLAGAAGWGKIALLASTTLCGSVFSFSALLPDIKQVNKIKLLPFVWICLCLLAANLAIFSSISYSSPAVVAFLVGLQVVWVAVFEVLSKQIKLRLYLVASIILSLLGVALINWQPQQVSIKLGLGEVLGILGGLSLGLSTFLIKGRRGDNASPFLLTSLQNIIIMLGALGILCFVFFQEGINSGPLLGRLSALGFPVWGYAWIFPVILGVGNFFLATSLQIRAQSYLDASVIGVLLAVQPVFTLSLGALVFAQGILLGQSIGGLLLILACAISLMGARTGRAS